MGKVGSISKRVFTFECYNCNIIEYIAAHKIKGEGEKNYIKLLKGLSIASNEINLWEEDEPDYIGGDEIEEALEELERLQVTYGLLDPYVSQWPRSLPSKYWVSFS